MIDQPLSDGTSTAAGRRHVLRLPSYTPHREQHDHGDDDQADEDRGLLFAGTPGPWVAVGS
jgi:hypothetical protein